MYGNGGDGFSWREQPDYYVAAYRSHPLVERCQLVERCLEPMLIAHPEIVNCKHPKTGETFLQYAVKTTTHPHVMRLLLEGNFETKIGLLRDNFDRTALHVALELGRLVGQADRLRHHQRPRPQPAVGAAVGRVLPRRWRARTRSSSSVWCATCRWCASTRTAAQLRATARTRWRRWARTTRASSSSGRRRGGDEGARAIASLRCSSSRGVEGSASQYVRGRNNRRQSSIFSASIQGTTTNALSVSASTSATRRTDDRPVGLMALPSRWFGKGRARSGFNATMRRGRRSTRSSRRARGRPAAAAARSRPTTTSPNLLCRCRRRARPSATRLA